MILFGFKHLTNNAALWLLFDIKFLKPLNLFVLLFSRLFSVIVDTRFLFGYQHHSRPYRIGHFDELKVGTANFSSW